MAIDQKLFAEVEAEFEDDLDVYMEEWEESLRRKLEGGSDKFAEDPLSGPALDQVAAQGQEGDEAERLLKQSEQYGTQVLFDLARKALRRLLQGGAIHNATSFFTPEERTTLAEALAATTATAELLGRARIRQKQQKAMEHAERFADCEKGQRADETGCTPKEVGESEHSHRAAIAAMKTAHPFPVPRPDDPPGIGNPITVSKSPALQAALAARDIHNDAYNKAHLVQTAERMLTGKPDKLIPLPKVDAPDKRRIGMAVRAIQEVSGLSSDVDILSGIFGKNEVVGSSHPQGKEVIHAALAEARRRYDAALQRAEEHVAGLPVNAKQKAMRALKNAKLSDENAERFAETIPASQVLAIVQASPQHQGRDIDWPGYARRFGVQGNFVRGTASVSRLWDMLKSGEMRESQKLDADDIREKARTGAMHQVTIAQEPGRGLIIVDGTHSAHAARLAGRESIPVIVAQGAVGKVLEQQHAERFDENEPPKKPLKPKRALSWFRRLVPTIKFPTDQWINQQYETAFSMVRITDTEVLSRVQEAIDKRLETGEGISTAPEDIAGILDEAGMTPRNPQYPEMLFRTAFMDSLNHGHDEERMDPDVIETFPVLRYDGIADGREGEDHRVHFGKYFPAAVRFTDIRNHYIVQKGQVVHVPGKSRKFNCRCVGTAIPYWEWQELQARGVKLEQWPP